MTDTPIVVGLDLSLTGTGIAVAHDNIITTRTITTNPAGNHHIDRHQRLRRIINSITSVTLDAANVLRPDLVVLEGPSYGSPGSGAWDRAGLWWLTLDDLTHRRIDTAVVPPACRAKYATGSGAARKAAVIAEVARRYPSVQLNTDDEADAVVLAAMGRDHLGHPLAVVPKDHRAGLAKVAWPEVTA